MPVALVTSNTKNVGASLRYISTGQVGTSNQIHAKFNAPHSNRGDKSVTKRNYLLEGINTRNDFTNPKHDFTEVESDIDYWLKQKKLSHKSGYQMKNNVQATNYVISFGHDFDWRKPTDLMLGQEYVHAFIRKVLPHNPCLTGYQMDTRSKTPSAHTHICAGNVNINNFKSISNHQRNYHYLDYVEQELTNEFNQKHPDHIIHSPSNVHRTKPNIKEQSVINRILPVANNNLIKTPDEFKRLSADHGVIAHFKFKGQPIKNSHKKYKHNGLVLKVNGQNGSHGYIKASRLQEFIPSISVKNLQNQFQINQKHAHAIQNATGILESASMSRQATNAEKESKAGNLINSASASTSESRVYSNVASSSASVAVNSAWSYIHFNESLNSASTYNSNFHQQHLSIAGKAKNSMRSSAISLLTSQSIARDFSDSVNKSLTAKRGLEYDFDLNYAKRASLSARDEHTAQIKSSMQASLAKVTKLHHQLNQMVKSLRPAQTSFEYYKSLAKSRSKDLSSSMAAPSMNMSDDKNIDTQSNFAMQNSFINQVQSSNIEVVNNSQSSSPTNVSSSSSASIDSEPNITNDKWSSVSASEINSDKVKMSSASPSSNSVATSSSTKSTETTSYNSSERAMFSEYNAKAIMAGNLFNKNEDHEALHDYLVTTGIRQYDAINQMSLKPYNSGASRIASAVNTKYSESMSSVKEQNNEVNDQPASDKPIKSTISSSVNNKNSNQVSTNKVQPSSSIKKPVKSSTVSSNSTIKSAQSTVNNHQDSTVVSSEASTENNTKVVSTTDNQLTSTQQSKVSSISSMKNTLAKSKATSEADKSISATSDNHGGVKIGKAHFTKQDINIITEDTTKVALAKHLYAKSNPIHFKMYQKLTKQRMTQQIRGQQPSQYPSGLNGFIKLVDAQYKAYNQATNKQNNTAKNRSIHKNGRYIDGKFYDEHQVKILSKFMDKVRIANYVFSEKPQHKNMYIKALKTRVFRDEIHDKPVKPYPSVLTSTVNKVNHDYRYLEESAKASKSSQSASVSSSSASSASSTTSSSDSFKSDGKGGCYINGTHLTSSMMSAYNVMVTKKSIAIKMYSNDQKALKTIETTMGNRYDEQVLNKPLTPYPSAVSSEVSNINSAYAIETASAPSSSASAASSSSSSSASSQSSGSSSSSMTKSEKEKMKSIEASIKLSNAIDNVDWTKNDRNGEFNNFNPNNPFSQGPDFSGPTMSR